MSVVQQKLSYFYLDIVRRVREEGPEGELRLKTSRPVGPTTQNGRLTPGYLSCFGFIVGVVARRGSPRYRSLISIVWAVQGQCRNFSDTFNRSLTFFGILIRPLKKFRYR